MSISLRSFAAVLLACVTLQTMPALAQQRTAAVAPSEAEQILDQASQEGKYTFVLFYKTNDVNTSTMNKTLEAGVTKHQDRATLAYVQLTNPADQALVKKFDVSRAPMPMTLAIAPNGAITGIYSQKLASVDIDDAFVTPTMMQAMKGLQEGKLVFVTVHGTGKPTVPAALRELQADPHFNTRLVTLVMKGADPEEAMLMEQMKIDPKSTVTNAALLAPPGVLIGKFGTTSTKAEIAAALAKAGKCCDDPNCQHNQASTNANTRTASPGTPGTQKK